MYSGVWEAIPEDPLMDVSDVALPDKCVVEQAAEANAHMIGAATWRERRAARRAVWTAARGPQPHSRGLGQSESHSGQ